MVAGSNQNMLMAKMILQAFYLYDGFIELSGNGCIVNQITCNNDNTTVRLNVDQSQLV